MTNRTVFGAEMRRGVKEGIDRAANSVAPTLGGGGLPIFHYMEGQDPKGNYADYLDLTKDGVSVLKSIQSLQPLTRIGEKLVREASEGVVKAAGDGTTATAILVQAICQYGMEALDEGYNPVKLKREIEAAVKDVVAELKKLSKPVEGIEDLIKIATISANNDPVMGKIVAEAFEKVGVHGIITADISTNIEDSIEVADGMVIDKGYTNPNFMNNPAKGTIELNDCYILMLSEKFEDRKDHVKVILDRFFLETQAVVPVLIVAEEFGVTQTNFLLANNFQHGYKFACINTPAGGAQRDEIMDDLAKVTNGIHISGRQLDRIEGIAAKCPKYKADPNNPVRQFDGKYIVTPYFGKAKKVIINLTSTTIIGGEGKEVAEKNAQAQRDAILEEKAVKLSNNEKQSDKWEGKPQVAEGIAVDYDQKLSEVRNEFDVYVDNIRERITNEKNPQLIDFLKKRLANITGSVAVINVGGLNEQSIKERKDRYDDAICAVKAASEEGYLAGGGTALMYLASKGENLDKLADKAKIFDRDVYTKGTEILYKAMKKPFEQILINAGVWEKDEEGTPKHEARIIPSKYGQGYNALTGEIVNMFDKGIIDSTKVVRCEIEYAANAAITFLTAGGAIC